MRRRIVALTTAVAAVAVLVLGVPLVLVGRHQARTDARARVDREADAIVFALGATFDRGEPVTTATLAPFARSDRFVVVRDASGTVTRAGTRPTGRTVAAHVATDGARITLLADAHEVGDRSDRDRARGRRVRARRDRHCRGNGLAARPPGDRTPR